MSAEADERDTHRLSWVPIGLFTAIIAWQVLTPLPAQDFLPNWVAAALVAEGHCTDAWPGPEAATLADVRPSFAERSLQAAPELERGQVMAFLSPPAAALPWIPTTGLSFGVVSAIVRLLCGSAVLVPTLLVHRRLASRSASERLAFGGMVLGLAPLFAQAVAVGQTSVLLFAACALWFALPPGRLADAVVGVVTGLAALFKVFPAGALVVAAALGRPRATAAGLALVAALWAVASMRFGLGCDAAFFASLGHLGGSVVTGPQNLSLLATLHGGSGLTLAPVEPPLRIGMASIGVIGLGIAIRGRSAPERAWTAAWAAMLLASPLVWLHYLMLLPPLLLPVASAAIERWGRNAVALPISICIAGGLAAIAIGDSTVVLARTASVAVLVLCAAIVGSAAAVRPDPRG